MSSTFMGLETSKRGLTAQQTALYTVGHNISNANTIGYTRQRVNLVATDGFPSPGMNSPKMAGHLGTGVTSDSIQRIRDSFIDTQYRQESTNLGYWSAKAKEVSQLEDIFSEPSEYGLNKSFDDFYQALQTLSTNPGNAAARQVVAEKGAHLADSFNYINKQLTQVQTNLKNNIRVETKNVNSLLTQIASLNKQISDLEPNGYLPNDLYDQRDNLLDSLSEYFKIETQRVPSGGNAKANAEGSLNVFIKLDDGSKIQVVKGTKEATMVSNFSQSKTTGIDYSDDYGAFISFGFTDATYITKEGTILATDDKGIALKDPNNHNIYLNADDQVLLTDAQGNLVKNSAGEYVTNEGMYYYEKVGSDTFVKDIEGKYITDASGANVKVDRSMYQAVDLDGKALSVNGTPIVFSKGAMTDVSEKFLINNNGQLFDASGKQYFSDATGKIAYQYDGTNWTDLTGVTIATPPNNPTPTVISTNFGAAIDTSGNAIAAKSGLLLVDTSDLEGKYITDATGANVKVDRSMYQAVDLDGKALSVNGTPVVFSKGSMTDVSGKFSINNGQLYDASGSKQYFSDTSGNIAFQYDGTNWTDLTGVTIATPPNNPTPTVISTNFGAATDTSGKAISTKNGLLLLETSNLKGKYITDATGANVKVDTSMYQAVDLDGNALSVNGTSIVFSKGSMTDVSGKFLINNGQLFDASGSKQYFSDATGNIAYQYDGTNWTDLTGAAIATPLNNATPTLVSTNFGAAIDTSGKAISTKNGLLHVGTSTLGNPILTDNTGKPVLTTNKEVITDEFGYTVVSDDAGRYLKDINGNVIDKGLEIDTVDKSIVYVTDLNGTVLKDSTGQPIQNKDGLFMKQVSGSTIISKWDGTTLGTLDSSGATLLAKTNGTVATYPSGGNIVLHADGTLDNPNYQVLDGKLANKNGEPVIPQIEIATDYSIAKDTSGNPITNGVNPVFLNNNGEIVLTNGGTTPLRDQNGNLVVDMNGYHTDTTSPYTYKDYNGNVYQETPRILGSALTAEQLLSGIGKMKALVDSYGYTTGEPTVDQEQSKGLLPEKIKELNDLARAFAEKLNDLHDDGYTLSTASEVSKQGGNFFTAGREGQDKITAANIQVSEAIRNNLNLIAASTGIDEEGNGSNAIKLANVKSEAITRLNNASAQTFYESIVADVGVKGEQANRLEYNSTTIRLTIANNRDSVSSVSLDEEMTNMITFQQAYNASARMITVVDETLDKIINGMGRVGL